MKGSIYSAVICPHCGKHIWVTMWPKHAEECPTPSKKFSVDGNTDDAYDRSMKGI